MQNHLDAGQRSFAMLGSSDPFGPPTGHEHYTTLANHNHSSPTGADFGHLLTSANGGGGGGGGNPPPMVNSNHHNHAHHNHNTSNNNSNNNNSSSNNNNNNNNNSETKPKKALPPNGKKTKGRVKIKMEFIDNKLRRYTTFSKRKTGIMKKAYELSTLTGTQVMLLVASETGHVYTFATRKLQPMITSEAGKALIQTCLNSPDPPGSGADPQRMSATGYEETELTYAADPNASDHGDTKDGESESGSSDGEDQKEVPPLLPLSSNGILSPNFAALIASATAAAGLGGSKGPFSLDLTSQIAAAAAAAVATSSTSSSSSSSASASATSSSASVTGSSSSHHHHHHHHHNNPHHHSQTSSSSSSNNSQSSPSQQELLLLQQSQIHQQQAQLQKQIQMQQHGHHNRHRQHGGDDSSSSPSPAKIRIKREPK